MYQNEFFAVLNTRVFEPALGRRLSFQECKHIVDGVADVIIEMVIDGENVFFGKMGVFKHLVIKPRERWDPRRRKKFMAKEKRKIIFSPSKSTQRLFAIF